jgi:G3E family GTPase
MLRSQITGAELAFLEKIDITHHLQIKALGDVVKLLKEIAKLKASLYDEQALQSKMKNNTNNTNAVNSDNYLLEQQLEEMK